MNNFYHVFDLECYTITIPDNDDKKVFAGAEVNITCIATWNKDEIVSQVIV